MIQASPNLRSLDLGTSYCLEWNATPYPNVTSSLKPVDTFRELRTYRAKGRFDPDWSSFFEAPEINKLRLFLQLHPYLHTVNISSTLWPNGYTDVDPQVLASMFPCLRHFGGPAFLCEALVQSNLAPGLESLGISHRLFRSDQPGVTKKTNRLPELQALMHVFDDVIDNNVFPMSAMSAMLAATPKLTHLFISHVSANQLESLPDALRQTPDLRILTTSFLDLIHGTSNEGGDLQLLLDLVKPLAAVCPRLEHLYNSRSFGGRSHWEIVRKDGEAVRVDFYGLQRDIPRYWEDD
ncbi:hypothetical protein BDV93DRAFT_332734 [Ceratobasidium sp. AG-I]|nr:hypothetical protein BDV93DRAFT_332734 [Ceratobasidium sp. AG-I]